MKGCIALLQNNCNLYTYWWKAVLPCYKTIVYILMKGCIALLQKNCICNNCILMKGCIALLQNNCIHTDERLYCPITKELHMEQVYSDERLYCPVINVFEWLLFNAKWAIFQQCHGENKLHSMRWWPLCTIPIHLVL